MVIGNENGLYENVRWHRVASGLYEDRADFWIKLREDHQLSRWNGSETLKLSIIMFVSLLMLCFAQIKCFKWYTYTFMIDIKLITSIHELLSKKHFK